MREVLKILKSCLLSGNTRKWRDMVANLQGVSEETTTGVHRLE